MTNSVWQATIQNATGDIVIGAEITVIDESTGLDATIFSTRAGAALTNPFFSDANGFAQFYAGPGEYRIQALDNGTGLTQILRYVRLGDAGSVDTGTATGQVLLSEDAGLNGGETNWTSGNLDTENFDGVGSRVRAVNLSGGNILPDATIAGASILSFTTDGAGNRFSSVALSGTYKNISGLTVVNNTEGDFYKVFA